MRQYLFAGLAAALMAGGLITAAPPAGGAPLCADVRRPHRL
jgi:hypothetical protein